MATSLSFYFICVFLPYFFLFVILAQGNFCYLGNNVDSQRALQNLSCVTGTTHMLQTLFVTDYDKSSRLEDNPGTSNKLADEYLEDGETKSEDCFVFRHVVTRLLEEGTKYQSANTVYGCDFENICENVKQDEVIYNVTYKNQTGQLFCCRANNCNGINNIPHDLPSENRICHDGIVNHADMNSAKVLEKSCSRIDAMCVKKTVTNSTKDIVSEQYHCDEDQTCEKILSVSGAYKSCNFTTLESGLNEKLCCCDQNRCFAPDNVPFNSSRRFMNKPLGTEGSNTLVMSGLVASLFLIVSFGVGIAVMFVCKRRQASQDPNVIMQYERLSNSEMEGIEAVVL